MDGILSKEVYFEEGGLTDVLQSKLIEQLMLGCRCGGRVGGILCFPCQGIKSSLGNVARTGMKPKRFD